MIDRFIKWFDRSNFIAVRSGVLYVTVGMTWLYTERAFVFATSVSSTKYTGMEVAAILTAIGVPLAALQGFIFSRYSKSRDATK